MADEIKRQKQVAAGPSVPPLALPEAKESPKVPLPRPAHVPTVNDVIAHLLETGTPAKRLEAIRNWLDENSGATAQLLYGHLEATGIALGTLRKAGKFIFGEGFEPESAATQVPTEELQRLREEIATLKRRLGDASADKLAMVRQRDYAIKQATELREKLAALRVAVARDELAAIGEAV